MTRNFVFSPLTISKWASNPPYSTAKKSRFTLRASLRAMSRNTISSFFPNSESGIVAPPPVHLLDEHWQPLGQTEAESEPEQAISFPSGVLQAPSKRNRKESVSAIASIKDWLQNSAWRELVACVFAFKSCIFSNNTGRLECSEPPGQAEFGSAPQAKISLP